MVEIITQDRKERFHDEVVDASLNDTHNVIPAIVLVLGLPLANLLLEALWHLVDGGSKVIIDSGLPLPLVAARC